MIYLIDPTKLANRPPCDAKCRILCDKITPLYGIDI